MLENMVFHCVIEFPRVNDVIHCRLRMLNLVIYKL